MSWRDWIGYPGMGEHEIQDQMIDLIRVNSETIGRTAQSANQLADIVKGMNDRLVAVENVLRTHGLAK